MAKVFRVSGQADIHPLAAAIAHVLRADEEVILRTIGANAVHSAVKAAIVARDYLRGDQIDLTMLPRMENSTVEGEEMTVMELEVRRVGRG